MKFFRYFFGAFVACVFPAFAFGFGLTVTGPTGEVAIGEQYTITATLQVRNQGEIPSSITITRDSMPVAQNSNNATLSYTNLGESTGPGSVIYSVRGVYRNGSVYSQNYTVAVKGPSNHKPTVSWGTFANPKKVIFGTQYNISAEGHDEDGNLSSVNIFCNGEPFAFALNQLPDGTPQNYGAWSGNDTSAPSTYTTLHYSAIAFDSAGEQSDPIYWDVDVRSANAPIIDYYGLSVPYINQVTDIVVNAHDPDDDIKDLSITVSDVDNPVAPQAPSTGQHSISYVGHNHHNPGPNTSSLIFWIFLSDWSGNDGSRYILEGISVDNRSVAVPTLTAAKVNVELGQSIDLDTYAKDDDSNLTQHFIYYRLKRPGEADYGDWQTISATQFANGTYDHTFAVSWAPPEVGDYEVKAYDTDPYTDGATTVHVVAVAPPDTTPPAPPTNVTAGTPEFDTIPISWTASTSTDVTKYLLIYGTVNGAQTTLELGVDISSYPVRQLSPGVAYQFVMKAQDGAGNVSDPSNQVTKNAAKLGQTITFNNPGNQVYNVRFGPGAASTSGLPITYTIQGPASVSNDNQWITPTGVGAVTVTASQAGDSVYNPAQSVSWSFTVDKATQTITFYNPGTHTYGDPAFDLGAKASSGLGITYTVEGPATRQGSMLTVTGAGTVKVTASQGGNENYYSASLSQTFTVNRAAQTITFAGPANHTYGDAAFDLVASASSNLPVSFCVVSGPAMISGAKLTISGAGTVTVRASQGGDTDHYLPAANVDRAFTINKANQTITFANPGNQVAGSSILLTATASSNLPVAFSVDSGPATVSGATLSLNGTGTVKVTASQGGDANYNGAPPVPQSFIVTAATQPVVSISPTTGTVALGGSVTFTASGGGFGGYTWGGTAGATGNGTSTTKTVQFNSVGSYTVTVSSPGDATHGASNAATATITVSLSTQPDVSIAPATASVNMGASVTFTVSGGGVGGYTWGGTAGATGSGPSTTQTISFLTEGNFTVTVQSPGDSSTGASNTAMAQITVTKILTPIVSISPLTAQTVTVGDSITFSSTATDADANMTDHNLDWLCPDGNWNWQGGQGAASDVDPTSSFSPKGSSTRTVTLTFNVPGAFKVVWSAHDPAGWSQSASVQVTVKPGVVLSDISDTDDDNDGVPDAIEQKLGITPADVHLYSLEYDKIDQLKSGAFGQYIKDAEGNIKQVRN